MSINPTVSIIFPVKNEGENVENTVDSLFSAHNDTDFEIIIVDDASTDGCCDFLKKAQEIPADKKISLYRTEGIGSANARNYGAEKAAGKYFVFCDAHLEFADRWLDHLLKPLLNNQTDAVSPAIGSMKNPDFTGYGQTLKSNLRIKWHKNRTHIFETPILPGACLAVSKETFEDIGGFEKGFKTWGYEDVEISIKLWLFGYRCHCEPKVKVLHLFRTVQPYDINNEEIFYNLMLMAYSHFNANRIETCRKLITRKRAAKIEKEIIKNGAKTQRLQYFAKRTHTDDWFFQKFNINF